MSFWKWMAKLSQYVDDPKIVTNGTQERVSLGVSQFFNNKTRLFLIQCDIFHIFQGGFWPTLWNDLKIELRDIF